MSIEELTAAEREFAERNYGLLVHFMRLHAVDDEHYGALSVRYLTTVKRYLCRKELQKHSFSTVLWMNLRSELFSIYRKARRRNELSLNALYIRSVGPGIAEKFDLRCAMKCLSNSQRELFSLWYCGYTYEEMAVRFRISKKAVEHRLRRIRNRMQKALK